MMLMGDHLFLGIAGDRFLQNAYTGTQAGVDWWFPRGAHGSRATLCWDLIATCGGSNIWLLPIGYQTRTTVFAKE